MIRYILDDHFLVTRKNIRNTSFLLSGMCFIVFFLMIYMEASSSVVLLLLFVVGLLLLFFQYIIYNQDVCMRIVSGIKQDFAPKIIYFFYEYGEGRDLFWGESKKGLLVDPALKKFCLISMVKKNEYEIMYYDLEEIEIKIVLNYKLSKESVKTSSASYGSKMLGGAVGGVFGVAVANAIGGKYEESMVRKIIKMSLVISSSSSDEGSRSFLIVKDDNGLMEDQVSDEVNYKEALKFRDSIYSYFDSHEMIGKFLIEEC